MPRLLDPKTRVTRTDKAHQRPPGAVSETLLEESCTSCGDCMAVCPAALIILDKAGFPLLLSERLCTQCGLCAEVCLPEAISFTNVTRAGLDGILTAQHEVFIASHGVS